MCGRFAFYSPAEAVVRLFGVQDAPEIQPRYNVAPTQFVASVRADDKGVRNVVMLRWGLVPSWAKDKSIGNRMINARAETAQSKPSFRSAFKRRRCLILADGFYEWQRRGAEKVPHFIRMHDGQPFALAGLWEHWRDPANEDQVFDSCTIITTTPNELTAKVHDRMPVILDTKDYARWLDPGYYSRDGLQSLLVPFPAERMQTYPVSRLVNSPKNDGPELIVPGDDQA